MVFLAFDHSDITTHSAATIRRAAVDARALRPDASTLPAILIDQVKTDTIKRFRDALRRGRQGRIGTRRIVWII